MTQPLTIDYYTDVLCVWAWIAQARIDELNKKLNSKIEINYYFIDVFGDVPTKMETQWGGKGGYIGFSEHVQNSVSGFTDAPVNPIVWTKTRPVTSGNVHLVIKAIQLMYDKKTSIEMALLFRKAFFIDALDIGSIDVLMGIVSRNGLDIKTIEACLRDGSAMAALMSDYQQSKKMSLKGSPSYVIDGGRQVLYGNVGYRVILANIEELLHRPSDEASWC